MRVGLLECDHVREQYLPIAGDYRDMFSRLLTNADPTIEVVPFDIQADGVPSSPDECDGWVCTGSRASVYGDKAWIADLSEFVRAVRAAGTPFVGICFGHQLLAHALGGRTELAEGGWGVGGHRLRVDVPAPWMDPPLDAVDLLYVHQDQVTALPDGGVAMGSSDHCPIAMFGVGPSMIGIQGHPEFTAGYVDALLADRADRIGADRAAAGRASLGGHRHEAVVGNWIVTFLRTASSGRPTHRAQLKR